MNRSEPGTYARAFEDWVENEATNKQRQILCAFLDNFENVTVDLFEFCLPPNIVRTFYRASAEKLLEGQILSDRWYNEGFGCLDLHQGEGMTSVMQLLGLIRYRIWHDYTIQIMEMARRNESC